MEAKAEEFVSQLLNEEEPKESIKTSEGLSLPLWIDMQKYNRGRKFFDKYYFGIGASYILGLVIVFVIPTMVKILSETRKSSTSRTAYLRYLDTFRHFYSWLHNELKPGSKSWISFNKVRKHHLIAMKSAKLKNHGTISQRDAALTLTAAVTYAYTQPDTFGLYQCDIEDWEAFNHYWAVIGYIVGLEDRYNLCKKPYVEACKICQVVVNRVFAPCLDNPPERFEHMVRVMLEGISSFYPVVEVESVLYMAKNLTGVPGYILKESERLSLRERMTNLIGDSSYKGIKSSELLEKCAIEGLPESEPRLLYISDFESIQTSPAYKQLPMGAKFTLAVGNIAMAFYSTFIGRVILNNSMRLMLIVGRYFPFMAVWRYGFAGVFLKDIRDDTIFIPNSEFQKPKSLKPWYRSLY